MITGQGVAAGTHLIGAGTARLFPLQPRQSARIITVRGSQVADTWVLCTADPTERLSMSHTRGSLGQVRPRAGDLLYSDRRRPILRFERDTSPGLHDTLVPACDPERYRLLGHRGYHRNCRDNYTEAVARLAHPGPVPEPWNVFQNTPVDLEGQLRFEPSLAAPGDFIEVRALTSVYLIVSACPQDLVPINGVRLKPSDIQVVLES